MRRHDAVLGCLRSGGLSLVTAADAYAILDSYVYGFTLQEAQLPFQGDADLNELAGQFRQAFTAGTYPYLVAFATRHALRPDTPSGTRSRWGST